MKRSTPRFHYSVLHLNENIHDVDGILEFIEKAGIIVNSILDEQGETKVKVQEKYSCVHDVLKQSKEYAGIVDSVLRIR